MLQSMLAVGAGAAMGAICRWLLGEAFNALFPAIPPGTLLANISGAYAMGIAMAVFATFSDIGAPLRLFVTTGFLGGLTTFSSFTAEMGKLLANDRPVMALLGIGLHVGGSLAAFFLGMATFMLARRLFGLAG